VTYASNGEEVKTGERNHVDSKLAKIRVQETGELEREREKTRYQESFERLEERD
jgi:hypothetical protein